jgi:hypothetical protein
VVHLHHQAFDNPPASAVRYAPVNLSKEERILRHKKFLSANWQLLAAFAWEQHLATGRGAVVVDERDFVHASSPQFAAIKLRYVSDDSRPGGWRHLWLFDRSATEALTGIRAAEGEEQLGADYENRQAI